MPVVGAGSHMISFTYPDPEVGTLQVLTGMDEIEWGYTLNFSRYPTYGGEVIQILSCNVDDLTVTGTLRSYDEADALYSYFFKYLQISTGGSGDHIRREDPLTMEYFHRNWKFDLIVTEVPGFRRARELTAPTWQIKAHVIDKAGDVDSLSETLIEEADIKKSLNASDPSFSANFGLEGKIRYTNSLFSDPKGTGRTLDDIPNTGLNEGVNFDANAAVEKLGDYYHSLLPTYIQGDFDVLIQGIGSRPNFNGPPSAVRNRSATDTLDLGKKETKSSKKTN